VFAVLDAFGVERCTLAAMSAGAAVAIGAVLQSPERFSGLVLVNALDLRQGPAEDNPFLAFLERDYAGALDYFVEACIPEADCEPIKGWGRKILDRAAPEAAIALLRAVQAVDLREHLSRVTLPTLILHGDADAISLLEGARWLTGVLPNARLVPLNGAGHVPIMPRPLEVAREIDAFLNR
jgi:pimeloyl-ACP methyl ester carboxylesterase